MTIIQPQHQHQEHRQAQPDHEWTSIRVHRQTLAKLNRLGKFKETYSEVVDRIASEKLGLSSPPDEGSW